MAIMVGTKKPKLFIGNTKVQKAFLGNEQIYSSGSIVTYMVDSGVSYQEEVDEGISVLNPTSFTPTKSGWTFVGWRQDTTVSPTVLTSLVMGETPITLYAMFKLTITLTYYNGSANPSTAKGDRYYNNNTVQNPVFTLTPASFSGWTFRGWAVSSAAAADIIYTSSTIQGITTSTAIYGAYSQSITLSYNGSGATGGSTAAESKTRYFNSGNYSNPAFTVKANGFSRTGYAFQQWRQGSTSGTTVAPGSTLTLTASTTLYAEWKALVINISSSNITAQFPNRSVWSTGNIGNQSSPDTLSISGHNGSVDMTMGFSTGNFTIPAGAKTIKLTARVFCWGTWSSLGWTLACSANGASQSTLINGGNGQEGENIEAIFSVNGATTISLSCSITWSKNFTGQEDGVWYGCSFASVQINY